MEIDYDGLQWSLDDKWINHEIYNIQSQIWKYKWKIMKMMKLSKKEHDEIITKMH